MLMYAADDTTLYCNLDQNSTSDSINNELKVITNLLMPTNYYIFGKLNIFIYHNINK